jgi:hypothetical protein
MSSNRRELLKGLGGRALGASVVAVAGSAFGTAAKPIDRGTDIDPRRLAEYLRGHLQELTPVAPDPELLVSWILSHMRTFMAAELGSDKLLEMYPHPIYSSLQEIIASNTDRQGPKLATYIFPSGSLDRLERTFAGFLEDVRVDPDGTGEPWVYRFFGVTCREADSCDGDDLRALSRREVFSCGRFSTFKGHRKQHEVLLVSARAGVWAGHFSPGPWYLDHPCVMTFRSPL